MQDKLWNLLTEDKTIGYVGVYGMAGVGKTYLLRALFDRFTSQSDTFKVLMIKVGEKPDITNIQEAIAGELEISLSQDTAAEELLEELTKKTDYVILFDDVWEKLPLNEIGIPDPKENPNCCKVVVAARLRGVFDETQIDLEVECMSPEDSWNLFEENVGDSARELFSSSQDIKDIAEEIVSKCEGLPVAIITVAKAMESVESISSVEVWANYAELMNNEPWNVPGMISVLEEMKRSYDSLPSDDLRSSLFYFLMYPKDSSLTEEWCADFWIGEGTVTGYSNRAIALEKARIMVLELLYAGLVCNNYTLHGTVRAMAQWISSTNTNGNKWTVLTESGLQEAPEAEVWSDAERLSLIRNNIIWWPEEPDCPNLVSLFLWGSVNHINSLSDGFFKFMPSLRVLDLVSCGLEELPPSIGLLHSLRYLDLALSSNLFSLPKELGDLSELRLLNLHNTTNLRIIPRGIFERLLKLEILRMDNSYRSWEAAAAGDDKISNTTAGAHAKELVKLKQLKRIDIVVDKQSVLKIITTSPLLRSALRSITFSIFRGTKAIRIPRDFGSNSRHLEWLTIRDCRELEELVFVGGSYSLDNLACLVLQRLQRLKKVVWQGPAAADCCLPALSSLRIEKCSKIEQLVGVIDKTFNTLQTLFLIELPALKTISDETLEFPSLCSLVVYKCPKLKRLPLGEDSGKNLVNLQGEQQWWDTLEWESESVKSKFDSIFEALIPEPSIPDWQVKL